MIMKKLTKITSIAFLAITMFSCSSDSEGEPTIVDIASKNPDFSILVSALDRAGLTSTLDGSGQFTVFAPTNAAFTSFLSANGFANIDAIPVATLKNILLNHVIGSEIKSAAIPASTYVSTLSPINATSAAPTVSMYVVKSGANVFINGGSATTGVKVTTADVDASNGVIHIVNAVIKIPTIVDHAVANPNFTTLVSLVSGAGLVPTLSGTAGSPFTVFAPTNAAFDALNVEIPGVLGILTPAQVSSVLTYHVVGGANVRSNAIPTTPITTLESGTFTIAGTTITDERMRQTGIIIVDVQGSNGVVHAINKVLLPTF